MSLFSIALRSILQRGVASFLTMLSMALGVMLVVAVLCIHGVISQSFHNNASLGYNVIVGAKGGQEQLVLNTVFYLSRPVENIPYTYYMEFLKKADREKLLEQSYATRGLQSLTEAEALLALGDGCGFASAALLKTTSGLATALQPDMAKKGHPPVEFNRDGKYGPMSQLAIPLCLGDYFGTFRVVGTTPELFNNLVYDIERNRKFEFAQGRNLEWRSKENGFFEAVAGATVARQIRLVEVQLRVKENMAEAQDLVTNYANWSRIESDSNSLTVALGQGVTESDFFLALRRLKQEVADGKRALKGTETKALDDLLDPQAVTRRTTRRLAVGDAISPRHGDPEGHVHARKFMLVGILKSSGTPNDRAMFVNMEGFYLMEDHALPIEQTPVETANQPEMTREQWVAKQGAERAKRQQLERAADPEPLPTEQREITAMLLKLDPLMAPGIENGVNEGAHAQAVLPVLVIYRLFEIIVNPIQLALLILTALICVVSGISILVSIYNSMSERRGEIAIMRALGAGRGTVMAIILLEATLLAIGGGLLGWLIGHTGAWAISPFIEERTGVFIGFLSRITLPAEAALIPALLLLAILVGLLPALSAYRTDVAKSLGK